MPKAAEKPVKSTPKTRKSKKAQKEISVGGEEPQAQYSPITSTIRSCIVDVQKKYIEEISEIVRENNVNPREVWELVQADLPGYDTSSWRAFLKIWSAYKEFVRQGK